MLFVGALREPSPPPFGKGLLNPISVMINPVIRFRYKLASEFVDDVRTVFDNCKVFNEDDSPIGNAGHTMRSLFENKWSQVENSMDMQEPIG